MTVRQTLLPSLTEGPWYYPKLKVPTATSGPVRGNKVYVVGLPDGSPDTPKVVGFWLGPAEKRPPSCYGFDDEDWPSGVRAGPHAILRWRPMTPDERRAWFKLNPSDRIETEPTTTPPTRDPGTLHSAPPREAPTAPPEPPSRETVDYVTEFLRSMFEGDSRALERMDAPNWEDGLPPSTHRRLRLTFRIRCVGGMLRRIDENNVSLSDALAALIGNLLGRVLGGPEYADPLRRAEVELERQFAADLLSDLNIRANAPTAKVLAHWVITRPR